MRQVSCQREHWATYLTAVSENAQDHDSYQKGNLNHSCRRVTGIVWSNFKGQAVTLMMSTVMFTRRYLLAEYFSLVLA